MGAQQGKENRGSSSSVGSGSHGGKTTKHKSKSKDTRISSGAGNIFTEHSDTLPLVYQIASTLELCLELKVAWKQKA
ncbi:hypothetical protein JTE90_005037 [Oedothorax gibbosus]|uniref:Uncharacterized protein n=1 Tax=Oedothorax gibbosus TaxID=931172 RepID=A0AAV6VAU3_9ARAC|nr:hypothetical protein JTE90_005037 [Oedothorax gibbosus]